MAYIEIKNVAIRGISACVPPKIEENKDLPFYSNGEAEKVISATGIERRHICSDGITASDLCLKAFEKLLADLSWEKETIDLVGYVTQNPDYINQPTSFVIHDKFGLPETCMCMDFFHGCPGWVVGMSGISSMVSSGSIKRAVLLDGDMLSHDIPAQDREAKPLFGDAGTATALEFYEGAPSIYFNIGTKSSGGRALIKEHGGYRSPWTLESLKFELDKRAGMISMEEVEDKMDSMDIFSFAISKVPKNIKLLCEQYGIDLANVDEIVLHQANNFMIQQIAKKLKVDNTKVPVGLKNFGNTSSASIPLTIISECSDKYSSGKVKTIGCGFGTGLAWGCIYFETDKIACPKVLTYEL